MQPTRTMLRLNAFTCLAFGLVFAVFPKATSEFLGGFPLLALRILGLLLIVHGGHLIFASLRTALLKWEVYYFSIGDLGWYLGSLLILVGTDFVTTSSGVWSTIAVAVMVMTIGMMQLWTYSEATGSGLPPIKLEKYRNQKDFLPTDLSRLKAIGVSWMGIKTWVKIWLAALNLVFLAAIAFWPTDFAKITITSYVATMPLLLSIMIVERGLTRLLGIGHLITWIPLMVYIWIRLSGDALGEQITLSAQPSLFAYALILLTFTGICLAFDVYDVARWWRGARARLGSETEKRKIAGKEIAV